VRARPAAAVGARGVCRRGLSNPEGASGRCFPWGVGERISRRVTQRAGQRCGAIRAEHEACETGPGGAQELVPLRWRTPEQVRRVGRKREAFLPNRLRRIQTLLNTCVRILAKTQKRRSLRVTHRTLTAAEASQGGKARSARPAQGGRASGGWWQVSYYSITAHDPP
jgi:hypothetical protein